MMTSLIYLLAFSTSIYQGLSKSMKNGGHLIKLDFIDQANKLGYTALEYDVTTEDGYILKLFHIPGKKGLPILLMHGILDSADTWIVRGEKSMAITLARADHDVWFGNCRGNMYSRRHHTLDPNKDKSFWDYSFHEHGYYDLPAFIDTILNLTGAAKINAIGHSQGNTMFYVMGSTRPDYNTKVNLVIALAPIAFLHNMEPPWGPFIKTFPDVRPYLKSISVWEYPSPASMFYRMLKTVCSESIGYQFCLKGVLFTIFGSDHEEVPPTVWFKVFEHLPHSTSLRNLVHFGQVAKMKGFTQYDHGLEQNLITYNATAPPEYDLGIVTMKVAMITSRNDGLCKLPDVSALRDQLPNVVQYTLLNRTKYNHVDFVWGENNHKYLFSIVLEILEKYGGQ